MKNHFALCLLISALFWTACPCRADVGVVTHISVVSDKVTDVSNIDAWARATLKPGMSDREKALAIWRSVASFQHQDAPPNEFLQHDGGVLHDPFKIFNVYGYSFCSVASADMTALGRHAGLQVRGRIINAHSVPEVFYDDAWHLMDASLICYFPKADGTLASVDEIIAGVKQWYDANPDYRGNDAKLRAFMRNGGWRKGPEVLSRCPQYDDNGWLPAATHGWYSTMMEYDGSASGLYEYGYSKGYQVNLQLRRGERLIRRWSNKGLHVNMRDGSAPGCLSTTVGQEALRYTPAFGDLAPGRVGNGEHVYDAPLHDVDVAALEAVNLQHGGTPALRVKAPAQPGVLTFRMPSSYVYLSGEARLETHIPAGGSIEVAFSDNHGLDWKTITTLKQSGEQKLNLTDHVFRRYDYRLRFTLSGADTGLNTLSFHHDIQPRSAPCPH